MTTGSKENIIIRLKSYLVDWFGDHFPLLESILEGVAEESSFTYGQYEYIKKQTRIKSATDDNLDLIATDFFGKHLQRKKNEADTNYRRRILSTLLQEKGTREGMRLALFRLTGFEPILFEPMRPSDTGAYNQPTLAYDALGAYSTNSEPYTAYITVFRPIVNGFAGYTGLGIPNHGYNVIPSEVWPSYSMYGWEDQLNDFVTDQDIYDVVEAMRPNSTQMWVNIIDKEVSDG